MKNPLVSIVLPTYNGNKQWITESINSVLLQTYENFEFIIINDASTNDIETIDLSKFDKRIRYFKNKSNLKLTKTLNKGISLSKGKYIARIDDDDIWFDKEKLAKQIFFMENNKDYALCGTSSILINEFGKEISKVDSRLSDIDIRNNILLSNQFTHTSVLIRKSVIDEVGVYDNYWNIVEDYEYWLRIGTRGKFANLPDYSVKYRINQKGISKTNNIKQKIMGLKLFFKYYKFYPNAFKGFLAKLVILIFPQVTYKFFVKLNILLDKAIGKL